MLRFLCRPHISTEEIKNNWWVYIAPLRRQLRCVRLDDKDTTTGLSIPTSIIGGSMHNLCMCCYVLYFSKACLCFHEGVGSNRFAFYQLLWVMGGTYVYGEQKTIARSMYD